jgi:hypothetical protein
MSYTLEKAINLLSNHFEEEIKKMKLFLDIKNKPDCLKKRIINKRNFISWTNSLHTIGLNEFSNELKTSLFQTIVIHSFLSDNIDNNNELQEEIVNFLKQL